MKVIFNVENLSDYWGSGWILKYGPTGDKILTRVSFTMWVSHKLTVGVISLIKNGSFFHWKLTNGLQIKRYCGSCCVTTMFLMLSFPWYVLKRVIDQIILVLPFC